MVKKNKRKFIKFVDNVVSSQPSDSVDISSELSKSDLSFRLNASSDSSTRRGYNKTSGNDTYESTKVSNNADSSVQSGGSASDTTVSFRDGKSISKPPDGTVINDFQNLSVSSNSDESVQVNDSQLEKGNPINFENNENHNKHQRTDDYKRFTDHGAWNKNKKDKNVRNQCDVMNDIQSSAGKNKRYNNDGASHSKSNLYRNANTYDHTPGNFRKNGSENPAYQHQYKGNSRQAKYNENYNSKGKSFKPSNRQERSQGASSSYQMRNVNSSDNENWDDELNDLNVHQQNVSLDDNQYKVNLEGIVPHKPNTYEIDEENWKINKESQNEQVLQPEQGQVLNANALEYIPADTAWYNKSKNTPNQSNNDKQSSEDGNAWNTSNYENQRSNNNWKTNHRKSFPARSHKQDAPKRYSEGSNFRNKETSKMWRNSDLHDKSFDHKDKEFDDFKDEERSKTTINFVRVKEENGDLFAMPKEYSLAHCVAEDMRMGSGIAVNFKREFKDLGTLLSQKQKQGGLAVLEDKDAEVSRFIYYLVTKRESSGKPTYYTFWSSVQKMRNHIRDNNVKKLAIPRLGCGLDRLEWTRVKHMIEFLFRDVGVEITVCNFQQTEESLEKLYSNSCKVVHILKSIADIEAETIILYLSSEDGHQSIEMEQLGKKFAFLGEFHRAKKQLGDVIKYEAPKIYYLLYGCVVRKTAKDPIDFKSFEKCLYKINSNNRKDKYYYIAIQALKDNHDDLLIEKIITLMRNCLSKVDVYVCWDNSLAHLMPGGSSQTN